MSNDLIPRPANQITLAFQRSYVLCQRGWLGPASSRSEFRHPEEMVAHTYRLPRGRRNDDGSVEYPIVRSRQDKMRGAQLTHPLRHQEGQNSWDDGVREMEEAT